MDRFESLPRQEGFADAHQSTLDGFEGLFQFDEGNVAVFGPGVVVGQEDVVHCDGGRIRRLHVGRVVHNDQVLGPKRSDKQS